MKITKQIKNIVFRRLLITLGILSFVKFGALLPVPGLNHIDVDFFIDHNPLANSIINSFGQKNTFVISIFTLNIFPYINATIFIQISLGFSSTLAKLQKEGDLEGKRSINRLTRLLTLIFAFVQSLGLSLYLKRILFTWNFSLGFEIIVWLTTGAMITVWLSELITEYGLGNGTSLLVYINIIANAPIFLNSILSEIQNDQKILILFLLLLIIFVSLYGIVFLQESVRKIPLISSKQLNQILFEDASKNYLPLKLNQAGVMPIIISTTLLSIPNYFIGLFPFFNAPMPWGLTRFPYWLGYFVLILISSSFYSTIILNPKDLSDQLQKRAVAIPRLRPGIQTRYYLKQAIKRITLVGSVILATIVTIPNFLESNLTGFSGLSTTSLLILSGVILDLIREVNSIYYSNVYNNSYQ